LAHSYLLEGNLKTKALVAADSAFSLLPSDRIVALELAEC